VAPRGLSMGHSEATTICPQTLARIMAINGAIDALECSYLYAEARQIRAGCIVEIGSYHGRSTAALALGSLSGFNVPVYAIDPHEHFVGVYGGVFSPADRCIFFKNMLDLGLTETVRPISLSSEFVTGSWPIPVSLLWVDGDHTYAGVRRDLDCWLPHLPAGALVIFDDATDPQLGPYAVIEELVKSGEWTRRLLLGKTVTLFRRTC
jgi:hypothetical protein